MKKVLELFAGSRSIGNVAEEFGMEVFSVDWTAYDEIDLVIDIELLDKKDIPFIPDVIWASPDCTTYSISAVYKHRKNGIEPVTDYAMKCDRVNIHWINLISEWLLINPELVFFIENPRGMLRKMPFMQSFTRHTIWYCKYGETRAKPTDIWTNSKSWIPRPECHNFKYDKQGNIVNKHCHHDSARRSAKSGTQSMNNSYDKSKLPKELCIDILESFL